MMYFKFENGFESFKLLFGKRMTNNGNSVRQNGILLSFLKMSSSVKTLAHWV